MPLLDPRSEPLPLTRDHQTVPAFLAWSALPLHAPSVDSQSSHLDAWQNLLTPEEKRSLISNRLAPARLIELCAGRALARIALSKFYPGATTRQCSILPGVFGQPILETPPSCPVPVSVTLSHTRRLVAALVFPRAHPIGLDLEWLDRARTSDLLPHFTPAELNLLKPTSIDASESIFAVWSAKEALSKILGTGLMTPFTLFEVDRLDSSPRLFQGTFRHFPQYRFSSRQLGDHVLSLVYPARSTLGDFFPPLDSTAIAAQHSTS